MSLSLKLLHGLASKAWVYDQIQALFGLKQTRQRLAPYLAETQPQLVLDVGAGTGLYRSLVPPTAQYIWLDLDVAKLAGFRERQAGLEAALLGEATRLSLADRSVDVALCIALSHHLTDPQLLSLWRELARVVRQKIIFLDALDCPDSLTSRLLWKYDRGSFPRSMPVLLSTSQVLFEVEQVEQFKIYHHLLLCVLRPKSKPKNDDALYSV